MTGGVNLEADLTDLLDAEDLIAFRFVGCSELLGLTISVGVAGFVFLSMEAASSNEFCVSNMDTLPI